MYSWNASCLFPNSHTSNKLSPHNNSQHTKAVTKCLSFCIWHFQVPFLEWKQLYFFYYTYTILFLSIYLNQWWPGLMTHIYVTQWRWFKSFSPCVLYELLLDRIALINQQKDNVIDSWSIINPGQSTKKMPNLHTPLCRVLLSFSTG